MRAEVALLTILAIQIILMESVYSAPSLDDKIGCWSIELNAEETLIVPGEISTHRAVENGTIDNNFKYIPVYSINQIINGSIQKLQKYGESNCSSRSDKSLCLSPFSIDSFLSGLPDAVKVTRIKCAKIIPDSNCTIRSSFQITNAKSGMYIAYAIGENGSKALAAAPLLITEGKMVLKAPAKVFSAEQYIQLRVNTTASVNGSKFFAAFMISRRDYDNVSLSLSENESPERSDLILSINSKSMELPSDPKISSELLMNMLPLLPPNSAVGLQESTQSGADLILLTDKPWASGEYVLTCCAYSPGKGLLGIVQSTIEII